jgi:hypothetical protein
MLGLLIKLCAYHGAHLDFVNYQEYMDRLHDVKKTN